MIKLIALTIALTTVSLFASDANILTFSSGQDFKFDLPGDMVGVDQATFKPPTGKRVRIISVTGVFAAIPYFGDIHGNVQVGFELTSTLDQNDHSTVDKGYAAAFVTEVDVLTPHHQSTLLSYKYDADFLLEADNVLMVKCFTEYNSTGSIIHLEPTFVIRYRFE